MKNNITNKTSIHASVFNIFNKEGVPLFHRRKPFKQLFQTNQHHITCYLWLHVKVRKGNAGCDTCDETMERSPEGNANGWQRERNIMVKTHMYMITYIISVNF